MRREWRIPVVLQANTEGTGGGGDEKGAAAGGDKPPAPAGDAGTGDAAGSKTGDQATGDKPGDQATGEGSKGESGKESGTSADDAGAESKVPDKYELTVPEGGEQFIDQEDLKYLEGVARASGWSNEIAQDEIRLAVERAQAKEAAQATRLLEQLKADPDYGGEKLAQSQQQAKVAIDKVFPPGHRLRDAFLKSFDRAIVGNNLVYVAFLAEVGRQMGEDSPTHARSSSGAKKDAAAVLYGEQK